MAEPPIEKTGICTVCGDSIPEPSWKDHLRIVHPAPMGGFRFWLDGRPFFTDKPSMAVGEIKNLANNFAPVYTLYQEIDGKDYALSDGQAVDLTREPRFCLVPPATY